MTAVQVIVIPRLDDYRPQAEFARRASQHVPPGQTIYIIDHPETRDLADPEQRPEPYVVYYLRPTAWRYRNEEEFRKFAGRQLRHAEGLYAIVTEKQLPPLQSLGKIEQLDRCAGMRKREKENQRLILIRITAN